MIKVAVNPWFERFILVVIVANSVCLAIDDNNAPVRPKWLDVMDIVFITIFTAEMIIKIIAMGFVMQPYSYLRDYWNIVRLPINPFSLTAW